MAEFLLESAKVIVPGLVGAAGGYLVKRWEVTNQARKVERELWEAQQRTHWSPLLRATRELRRRFRFLSAIYRREPGMPFDPGSLSADFRELYTLSREEIGNLQQADPNARRRDPQAVQAIRTRVCHELTFAESSLYIAVRYLGHAEHVGRDLDEYVLVLPAAARAEMLRLILGVRENLQGQTGAGIFAEQQEYIGESVWSPAGHVIPNLEFRQRLFDLPGWEQYANLLRFFVEFGPKVEHEIAASLQALKALEDRLDVLCASTREAYWGAWSRDAGPSAPGSAS